MLFFLVSCLSFLLLSQSFLKPHPTSKIESRMWTFPWIFRESLHGFFVLLGRKRKIFIRVFQVPKAFPSIKRILSARFEIVEEKEEEKEEISLLDLPDLALDCILEKLLPADLCSMAGVCSSLRESCKSDHLWEKHMKQKWGEVIGDAAHREWQCQIASKRAPKFLHCTAKRSKFQLFSGLLEFFGYKSEMMERKSDFRSSLPANSVMSCYLALETGKFWFPAQVFNREVQNGHVGFMLSCYDAQLSYGSTTDNFVARYPAQGRSMIEEGIEWNRIRAPSVDTPSNVLHISDSLDELKPGDHIEIQWRRNKEFPYGWWYGVVGHLESCGGHEFNCQCHISDTVILEFKQYTPGSRWRKTMISRKDHREVGNEADGFYGGIRKLYKKQEIAKWKQLWPNCTLE
ncbi:hypothetical protein Pfo_000986 [Paulownia fortunei]|nr:hypothetical protein Pfo_000986 [Paulownia fortunei]